MARLTVSRSWARLGAVALILLAGTGCASRITEVQRLQARATYERAQADLRDGNTPLALSAFREAVALDPGNGAYRNALGFVLLDLKLPAPRAEALAQFQKAIEIDPTDAEAHHNAGVALVESSRWKEAVAEYGEALSLPTFSTPDTGQNNLGWALHNLGRYAEAEEALRLAIRLNPRLAAAHYHLGLALIAQGRTDEAKVAFRRARELAPESAFGLAASRHLQALGDDGG